MVKKNAKESSFSKGKMVLVPPPGAIIELEEDIEHEKWQAKLRSWSLLCFMCSLVLFAIGITYQTFGPTFFVPSYYKSSRLNEDEVQYVLSTRPTLFIGGPHRGGTRLLWHMLASRKDAFSSFPDEVSLPYGEESLMQTVYSKMGFSGNNPFSSSQQSHNSGLGSYAFYDENYLDETSPGITSSNQLSIMNSYGYYWGLTKDNFNASENHGKWLLQKSPTNMIVSRYLQALMSVNQQHQEKGSNEENPNSSKVKGSNFLFITRHPIAVSLSHRNNKACRRMSLEKLLEHWIRQHEILHADMEGLNRVKIVTYEDLVNSATSAAVLRSICDWLGISFDASMLESVGDITDENTKFQEQYCGYIASYDWWRAHEELVGKFDHRLEKYTGNYSLTAWADDCPNPPPTRPIQE